MKFFIFWLIAFALIGLNCSIYTAVAQELKFGDINVPGKIIVLPQTGILTNDKIYLGVEFSSKAVPKNFDSKNNCKWTDRCCWCDCCVEVEVSSGTISEIFSKKSIVFKPLVSGGWVTTQRDSTTSMSGDNNLVLPMMTTISQFSRQKAIERLSGGTQFEGAYQVDVKALFKSMNEKLK